jgi:hypothetical protein
MHGMVPWIEELCRYRRLGRMGWHSITNGGLDGKVQVWLTVIFVHLVPFNGRWRVRCIIEKSKRCIIEA